MTDLNTFTFNGKKNTAFGLRLIQEVKLTHARKKREIEMLPGSARPVVIDTHTLENGEIHFPCTLTTNPQTTVFEQSAQIMNWLQEPTDFAPLTFVGDGNYQYLALHQTDLQLDHRLHTRGNVTLDFLLHPYKLRTGAQEEVRGQVQKNQKITLSKKADQKQVAGHRCFPIIEVQQTNDTFGVYLNDQLVVSISGYTNSFRLDTLTRDMKDPWGREFTGTYQLEPFEGLSSEEDVTIEIRSTKTGTVSFLKTTLNWGLLA